MTNPYRAMCAELVEQWISEHYGTPTEERKRLIGGLATKAAQWGADQELEACINYFYEYDRQRWGENSKLITGLRAARRPKPPSLKEQALAALGPEPQPKIGHSWDTTLNCIAIERHRLVRRALEALDD